MFTFTAATLLEAVHGTPRSLPADPERRFGITTDSRTAGPGQVFFALSGPRFDGHAFIPQVLELRDTGVVGRLEALAALPPALCADRLVVAVADPLTALGDAAAYVRERIQVPVVGLTGTVGKTTTKDLIRSILLRTGPGLATEGNLNNLIGLPLTLFKLRPEHHWVVLEMGMNAFGEIERMARIARPGIRLITNVGQAHTEGVGGIEGVARAKGELFATAAPGDTVVVNLDDPRVAALPVPEGVRRLTWGCAPTAEVRLAGVAPEAGGTSQITLTLSGRQVSARLPLIGRHNALNAAAAAAVAHALAIPAATIVEGLELARIAPMRMERSTLPGGVTVLNDAYNANPASMEAALDALRLVADGDPTGRTVAVLGDMLELGELEASAHRRLGELVAGRAIDRLFTCGPRSAETAVGALAAGMAGDRVSHALEHELVAQALNEWLEPGDVVLIKGSRGSRMERVLQGLCRLRGLSDDTVTAH